MSNIEISKDKTDSPKLTFSPKEILKTLIFILLVMGYFRIPLLSQYLFGQGGINISQHLQGMSSDFILPLLYYGIACAGGFILFAEFKLLVRIYKNLKSRKLKKTTINTVASLVNPLLFLNFHFIRELLWIFWNIS